MSKYRNFEMSNLIKKADLAARFFELFHLFESGFCFKEEFV